MWYYMNHNMSSQQIIKKNNRFKADMIGARDPKQKVNYALLQAY